MKKTTAIIFFLVVLVIVLFGALIYVINKDNTNQPIVVESGEIRSGENSSSSGNIEFVDPIKDSRRSKR